MDYNDVFADIMNMLLFHGEKRVHVNELSNLSVHGMYRHADGKLHEMERDLVKEWSEQGIRMAILGVENQTNVEKNMPFRVAGYEGASYRSQLVQQKGQLQQDIASQQDKILPVITLVLYFGNEHWREPKTTKELLQVSEELEPYVNDTKINVCEVAFLKEEQIEQLQSDFKIVANFFVQRRKNPEYIPEDTTVIEHVDEVLKLLSVMTGDNRYEQIYANREKEEKISMCTVVDHLTEIGEKRGIEIGEARGEKRGIEIGEARGEKRGIEIGKEREEALLRLLVESNRMEDIVRSVTDKEFKQSLYLEFNL